MIDDSHIKALAQPHNLVQVREFMKVPKTQAQKDQESQVLEDLRVDLEVLRYQDDVSRLIRKWQTETTGAKSPEPKLGLKLQAQTNDHPDLVDLANMSSPSSGGHGGVQLPLPSSSETKELCQDRPVSPIPDTVWKESLSPKEEHDVPTTVDGASTGVVSASAPSKIPGLFLVSDDFQSKEDDATAGVNERGCSGGRRVPHT